MSILDSKFYKILDNITSVVILQFLWMVACLPIITIIPATVALFSCIRGRLFNKSDQLIQKFFKELKIEFVRSNVVGIPLLIVLVSLSQYFYAFPAFSTDTWVIITVAVYMISGIYVLFLMHLLTFHVHMNYSTEDLMKNSFLAVFYQPLKSLAILIGILLIFYLSLLIPILFFLCSVSLIGFLCVYLILSKFHGKRLNQGVNSSE